VLALPPDLVAKLREHGRDLTILVLRLGALGDVLRTLPAVRLLRFALPESRLHWVVDMRWASLLERHEDLDGLVLLPRRTWDRMLRSPLRWPTLLGLTRHWIRELRSLRSDLALDFHGNLRTALIGVASGAPVRLGYEGHQQKEANRWFTTHRVPAGDRRTSRLDRNLSLPAALEVPTSPLPGGGLVFEAETLREARNLAAEATGRNARYAILSPGVSRKQAYKKPPAALMAAAARALADAGVAPLVVWGPGEEDDAGAVVAASGGLARLAPPTTLMLLGALVRRARLFVGGDSGPMHLACAVGCPVVALYGPTDPAVNAPWGVPHEALFPAGRAYTGIKSKDRAAGRFEGLEPAAVEDAIRRLLAATMSDRPS
jgi:heptosyltransferase I